MTLDDLLTQMDQPGESVVVPFQATLAGRDVQVTAVLKRTAVYIAEDGERQLVLRRRLEVDPGRIRLIPIQDHDRRRRQASRGRGLRFGIGKKPLEPDRLPERMQLCGGKERWCGTDSGYHNHRCRYEPCRLAHAEAERKRIERQELERAEVKST